MWVAGVDGCKTGWFCALRESRTGALRFELAASADRLLELQPAPDIIGIDIPIGLPRREDRDCDRAARALLRFPRSSSVFRVPVRAAIASRTPEEARRITLRVAGKSVSAQSWGIYAKIREVDELVRSNAVARRRLREVHPEVSFCAWNDSVPMRVKKKASDGRMERLRLAEAWLGRAVLAQARAGRLKKDVADDDVLDAIAALWTATRIAAGAARTLPADPPRDACGLAMEIVY